LETKDLSKYKVNLITGFLPAQDPVKKLPSYFRQWDQIAADLSPLLMSGRLRSVLEKLPVFDIARLEDEAQVNRAMLLLTVMGNAYVWAEGQQPAKRIPNGVAIPLWSLAEKLDLPPIVAHAHMALHNWHRMDESDPVTLDNLAAAQLFLGGMDEQWFYIVTVAIESEGGAAVDALMSAQAACEAKHVEGVVEGLSRLELTLQRMLDILNRMPEKCDPYVFYHRIRPYVAGWAEPGIIYEGVIETPKKFIGGSAAQSPLIQAVDAGLGVRHEKPSTREFLKEMRLYMLPAHRNFIEALENGPSIREFADSQKLASPTMSDRYNACLKVLDAFRQKHIELSVRFILHQAKEQENVKGTGGTTFVTMLSESRKETKSRFIE